MLNKKIALVCILAMLTGVCVAGCSESKTSASSAESAVSKTESVVSETESEVSGTESVVSETESEVSEEENKEDEVQTYSLQDGLLTVFSDAYFDNKDNEKVNGSDVKKVIVRDGVTKIGDEGFREYENLTETEIAETVKTIGSCAFFECTGMKEITIPDSVTEMGEAVFECCTSLEKAVLSKSLSAVSNNAFSECENLSEITIPESAESIGEFAFDGCTALKKIDISGSTLAKIDEWAFSGCTSAESIAIPESVTDMAVGVFFDWSEEQTISVKGMSTAPDTWNSDWNKGCNAKIEWNV